MPPGSRTNDWQALVKDPVSSSEIKCHSVSVIFDGGMKAVDQVDLTAKAGNVLSLVGPSGCGKTTMLRLIAGVQRPTQGSVVIDPPAASQNGEVGFVFQQPALLKWRTAIENVLLPLELMPHSISKRDRVERAEAILEQVGLSNAAHRFPHQLSGGMQMRVSIARALVTRPCLLLLDEPFASLDDMLRNQLGELFLSLWHSQRFTAVMVTHNIAEAVMLSHEIAVMRTGRLEVVIENDLPWPRTDQSRRSLEFGAMYGRVSDALRGSSS
ncbi:ABC transporter ATP-binding protein [Rubripirellula amarantea]|nr:ABC transporter ATP-binding protein [Rubripirellula amarantea]